MALIRNAVRAWAPAYENYRFRDVDGATEVGAPLGLGGLQERQAQVDLPLLEERLGAPAGLGAVEVGVRQREQRRHGRPACRPRLTPRHCAPAGDLVHLLGDGHALLDVEQGAEVAAQAAPTGHPMRGRGSAEQRAHPLLVGRRKVQRGIGALHGSGTLPGLRRKQGIVELKQ